MPYIYLIPYDNGSYFGQITRILANQTLNTNVNMINPQIYLQKYITECSITIPVDGNLLMYSGNKWINSDAMPDTLLF